MLKTELIETLTTSWVLSSMQMTLVSLFVVFRSLGGDDGYCRENEFVDREVG